MVMPLSSFMFLQLPPLFHDNPVICNRAIKIIVLGLRRNAVKTIGVLCDNFLKGQHLLSPDSHNRRTPSMLGPAIPIFQGLRALRRNIQPDISAFGNHSHIPRRISERRAPRSLNPRRNNSYLCRLLPNTAGPKISR